MIECFYLGTHRPDWLERTWVPLFVSHRRLCDRVNLPQAMCPWALDSGGFTELSLHGAWETSPTDYVDAVSRYRHEVGNLEWAAPQDWMCEPAMLAKTGLTVREHQERTVANYLELRAMAPRLPFVPVIQGWALADYHRCVEMYDQAGVDLREEGLVGLGSVCRRQATREIGDIVSSLAALGLSLHGFGVKSTGLGSVRRVPRQRRLDGLELRRSSRGSCAGTRTTAQLLRQLHRLCRRVAGSAVAAAARRATQLAGGGPMSLALSPLTERSPYDLCVCGHRREDHIGQGVGCVGDFGECGIECRRFRDTSCRARHGELYCQRETGHVGSHRSTVEWPS